MPRGMKGRGFGYGRGFTFSGGYAYGYPAYGYGAGYGRGFGRGRGIGAALGYCPYTGMPRGWRWYGYATPRYNAYYPNYGYALRYTDGRNEQ